MSVKICLAAAVLFLVSCSSVITSSRIAPTPDIPSGAIEYTVLGDAPPAFQGRLIIRCSSVLGKEHQPVVRDGAFRVAVRLDAIERDFTPIAFIIPPLLSYLGCPQGTVSRRFSIRITTVKSGRVLTVWRGKVRRPFGLYYMIPSAEKKMHDAILELGSGAIIRFFQKKG